jgi:hypothetical protein
MLFKILALASHIMIVDLLGFMNLNLEQKNEDKKIIDK